jgi:hypothetical protein
MTNAELPNPYESPRVVAATAGSTPWPEVVRRIVRAVILASIGYATITIPSVILFLMSVTERINFLAGILAAVPFALSEVFNSGPGKSAGVLRRIIVALGVVITSGIVVGIACEVIFPQRHLRNPDLSQSATEDVATAVVLPVVMLIGTAFVHRTKKGTYYLLKKK